MGSTDVKTTSTQAPNNTALVILKSEKARRWILKPISSKLLALQSTCTIQDKREERDSVQDFHTGIKKILETFLAPETRQVQGTHSNRR